jgi:hypothetical protein
MPQLIEIDRLASVSKAFLTEVPLAEAAAAEAQDRLAEAKAEAIAKHQNLIHLKKLRVELTDRLNLCQRDFEVETETHESTILELYGKRDLSPYDASRFNVAVLSLAHQPSLKRLVPRLRKKLEAELAELDKALAEATPAEQPAVEEQHAPA